MAICGSTEQVAALENTRWQCGNPNWLPRGTADYGDAQLEPIWLTIDDAASNGVCFLLLIDGARSAQFFAHLIRATF
jgi:DNA polymerase-3 subunit chi